VRLEEDVLETPPPESVTTLGEEIVYFHQPDEDLRLEDVLPDMDVETPEEHAERTELRVCVNARLTALPPRWRRALLLRYVDGLTGAALAHALGTTEGGRASARAGAR
jgi:DNA-directed RNA polymerase specialized sigma24 family protein